MQSSDVPANDAIHADVRASVRHFLDRPHGSFIGGKAVRDASDGLIDVFDPATENRLATVPAAGQGEVDAAVASARQSFDDGRWRDMVPEKRRDILWTLSDIIKDRSEELAQIDVLDNGMPFAFARWEMDSCVNWLRQYAGQTTQLFGRNASSAISGGDTRMHAYTQVQPVGVAALIVPWNAPTGNMMIKLAPALATGCSAIIKPAEETPLTAMLLGELCLEAGIPEGVVNIVIGTGRTAGAALVAHPDVDKVSFTGSTETGKAIVAAAASNLKRVTLELGGKSPVIVFDDADLEQAIPAIAMAIFANSGQICFAGSRLFVQRGIYDKVVAGVAEYGKALKIGSGFDPANMLGPLISGKQHSRVLDYIGNGLKQGAELVSGGHRHGERGYFVEPTIFANIARDMTIVREEIFGPVLVATPFDAIEDAVKAANDTRFGLGAGVFTQDVNKAHLVASRINSGNVWVNCYGITHSAMPFGGMKESGWGRELGTEVIDAFTEKKSVYLKLND